MQTSCGSPCYAAPELVISEGSYVGSAVDIWSCGVILYAMLAGYLPFDDDPANPDGDNINLLYKYIVNTPLSFPDYISEEARDLLGMMLVPDPVRRSSLEAIMRHSWLAAYAVPKDGIPPPVGVPIAFGKSVDQLERAAMEQHQQKRLAYQRQMKAAAMAASQHHPTATPVGRSQSHYIAPGSGHRAAATEPGVRSHSAQPEYLYDSSVDLSASMSTPGPLASSSAKRAQGYGSPRLGMDDDPFGPPPSASAATAQLLNAESPRTNKAGGDFRHTIQVEYDEPRAHRRSEDTKGRSSTDGPAQNREASGSAVQQPIQSAQRQQQHQRQHGAAVSPLQTTEKERSTSLAGTGVATTKPLPPSPLVPAPSPHAASTSASPTPYFRDTSTIQQGFGSTVPDLSPHVSKYATGKVPTSPSPSRTPTQNHTRHRPPSTGTPEISIDGASPPATPIKFAPSSPAASSVDEVLSKESKQVNKGHRKGRPSLDKIGLAKVFGGTSKETNTAIKNGSDCSLRAPSDLNVSTSERSSKSASSVLSSTVVTGSTKSVEKPKEGKDPKKTSRRNTLTVMVEPFRMRSRGPKSSKTSGEPASAVSPVGKDHLPFKSPMPQSTAGAAKTSPSNLPAFAGNQAGELGEGPVGAGMYASTNKAWKVMHWFRSKSKVRDVAGGIDEEGQTEKAPRSKTPTQAEYSKGHAVSNTDLPSSQRQGGRSPSVQVVVTSPAAVPTFGSLGGRTPQRTLSNATATDASFSPTTSLVTRFRNSVTIGNSYPSAPWSSKSAGPWGTLRTHHGAVDQSTITTKPPPEVIKHVKEVLEGMGVEIYVESEYKFRCVRGKKRKGSMAVGMVGSGGGSVSPSNGVSPPGAPGIAAITIVGSAASNGVRAFFLSHAYVSHILNFGG